MGALLAGAGADDLVVRRVVEQHRDQLGDPLVRVGHVGVGPHDDLAAGLEGADPPGRAGTAVAPERHDPHRREPVPRVEQQGERVVGRGVVDGEQLVGQAAVVHRRADPLDLGDDVLALVEARQHDRHQRRRRRRRRSPPARCGGAGRPAGRWPTIGRTVVASSTGAGFSLMSRATLPALRRVGPPAVRGSSRPRRRSGGSSPEPLVTCTRPFFPTRTTTRFAVVRQAGTDRSGKAGRRVPQRPRGDEGRAGRVPGGEVHHDGPGAGRSRLALAGDLDADHLAGADAGPRRAEAGAGVEHPGGGLGLEQPAADDLARAPTSRRGRPRRGSPRCAR